VRTADQIDKPADRGAAIALGIIAVLALLSLGTGCATGGGNVAVTINFFGSLSRFGQALGGTNTQLRGEFAGGGALTATLPTP
jgi:hypothetical protein